MHKRVLCLDFDGVIHSYESGWKGADIIPDPPVPGALEFIVQAMGSFKVVIFSSRSHYPGGIEAIKRWLLSNLIAQDFAHANAIVEDIDFPLAKPLAFLMIDDRALTFTGTWPEIAELHAFKTWNKR